MSNTPAGAQIGFASRPSISLIGDMVVPGGSPRGRIRRAPGFTLIELLTVMAIIAILAGIIIGAGRRANEAGKVARAKAELAALAAALETYRWTYGDYPQTNDAARLLQSLLGRRGPSGAVITARAMLDTARFALNAAGDPMEDPSIQLLDPWDRPYLYIYKVPLDGWVNASPVLYSSGPDGLAVAALLAGGFPDPAVPGAVDDIFAYH